MKSLLLAWGKTLLTFSAALAIAYVILCSYLFVRQSRFIFFPSPVVDLTPADLGIAYEDVWLSAESDTRLAAARTEERDRLHGWWIPASTQQASETKVLLYLHGNGENVSANAEHAARFHRLGFSVFLFDYRGYGRSEGAFPTEESVYQDAETAWQYLTETRQIPPEQIYIYGHSLGGAIAIELANHHPEAAGLIVESSFTSIEGVANWTGGYRLIPVSLLLTQRFDSIDKVSTLQMPVFFIHGTADTEIPFQMSQMLYEAAPEPKRLWLVPGANHNNVAALTGAAYFGAIRQFVFFVENQQAETVRP